MTMTCPKCGHQRTDADDPAIPDAQCPTCGIFYFKYLNPKNIEQRSPHLTKTSRKPIKLQLNWIIPIVKKLKKLVILIWNFIFSKTTPARLFLMMVLLFLYWSFPDNKSKNKALETVKTNVQTAKINPDKPIKKSPWSYAEKQDKMGRGLIKSAYTQSINQISFGFPYQGLQNAALVLRKNPSNDHDIALILDKAHFLCHINDCSVAIKFDDNSPENYPASNPQDLSKNMIYIGHEYQFLTSIKHAKKLLIEASFFQEGRKVFVFNVSDLTWDYPTK